MDGRKGRICLEMWFSDMVDNLFFFFFFSCRLLGRVRGGMVGWECGG